jgi:hypothetical protein
VEIGRVSAGRSSSEAADGFFFFLPSGRGGCGGSGQIKSFTEKLILFLLISMTAEAGEDDGDGEGRIRRQRASDQRRCARRSSNGAGDGAGGAGDGEELTIGRK